MLLPLIAFVTLSGVLFFAWKSAMAKRRQAAVLWQIFGFLFASPYTVGVPIGLGIHYGVFWGLISGATCCTLLFLLPRMMKAVLLAVQENPEPERKDKS